MNEPDFTHEERYIIAYYNGSKPSFNWFLWLLHIGMAALLIYGLYLKDNALVFAAFGVVICWRVYESSHQGKYFRNTQSIMQKYAARIKELSENVDSRNEPRP